ncbi:MAG: glycine--tRNA ligase subunit beta [Acidobacteriota bacterium]|nr:glycine--tRNA ligase subunit beta [Acidobacteriota bacterium]
MSGRELLIEIGCEEIPADWVEDLAAEFAKGVSEGLEGERLIVEAVRPHSTARRLVVQGTGVANAQEDQVRDVLGPPWQLAKDSEGGWSRAAVGFARRHGIGDNDFDSRLRRVAKPRGEYLGVRQVVPGRKTLEILPGILENALRSLDIPKSMNWDASIGGKPFPFARPIRWIVALFGGDTISFRIDVAGGSQVVAGDRSVGHRSRTGVDGEAPGASFTVRSFDGLRDELRDRYVVLDDEERKNQFIAALARCEAEGGERAERVGIPEFHKNLVEYPDAVLGTFPEEFLALPREIRHTVLMHHQNYFPFPTKPHFIAVTNLPDDPKGYVRRGAERVVVARFRDARFFWDEDRKLPLAQSRARLSGVVFHHELGSFAEKADRTERLAGWIAEEVGADANAASKAAGLAKCDLTSNLVGEFASLQGVVGGLLLCEEGVSEAVWQAVYDHYRPAGLEGDLPRSPEGAAVSLADRADTLAGLFLAGEQPSGSGDPYALRRAALSMIRILRDAPAEYPESDNWPTPYVLLQHALGKYGVDFETGMATAAKLTAFMDDRLPHAFASSEAPRGVVNAVLAIRNAKHPVADTRQRIVGLAKAVGSGDYATLAFASRRVRRILPVEIREGRGEGLDPILLAEPAEKELHAMLERVEAEVLRCFAETRYFPAFQALATLSPVIATFFDKVLVMAEDDDVRENRLALLARLDALFSEVGDLSQIEASAS